MKHIIFTISILVSSLTIGFSQDVPEVQQSLITKITATWCPNCGGWGWTFFENIYDDNADKALLIAAHYSGELQTSVSSDFADNFNISYQPFFILGNENQNVNGETVSWRRENETVFPSERLNAEIQRLLLNLKKAKRSIAFGISR